jgi:hypothetical protein
MLERMKNASIQVNVEKQIVNVGLRLFSGTPPVSQRSESGQGILGAKEGRGM